MDEAETLCNRVAIQVNGQIFALGRSHELKTAFSPGFVITVQLKPNTSSQNVRHVKEFIKTTFESAKLRDTFGVITIFDFPVTVWMIDLWLFQTKLCYVVQDSKPVWSRVFRKLLQIEQSNKRLVSSVSVTETSLVDILLQIKTMLTSFEELKN